MQVQGNREMNILAVAAKVLKTEAAAVLALTEKLDSSFEKAIDIIYECKGRVVVTGMANPVWSARR